MKTSKRSVDEGDFEAVDSGSSLTYPVQCSALRKNGVVMIKGQPCKIVEMATSKTGKHGHAKVHLIGISMVTDKKYEDLCPSTHNMQVPNVDRKEYILMNVSYDGFLALLDPDTGLTMNHIKMPDNTIGQQLKERHAAGEDLKVTITKVMDFEIVSAIKLDP